MTKKYQYAAYFSYHTKCPLVFRVLSVTHIHHDSAYIVFITAITLRGRYENTTNVY